jgi:hypothetical protein
VSPLMRKLHVVVAATVVLIYVGHHRQIVQAAPIVVDWCSNLPTQYQRGTATRYLRVHAYIPVRELSALREDV